MKMKMKRLLGLLLSLALVLGLLPGMSLTAYAAETTVTWNKSDINMSGIIHTSSGDSFTKDGVTVNSYAIDVYDNDVSIRNLSSSTGTFTTTLGNFTKIEVTAMSNVSGTGWSRSGMNATWTGEASSSVPFKGSIMGDMGLTIVFTIAPAHTHSFSYSASGATITATCGEGCDITDGKTLTISAPTGDLVADGTKTFPATLSTGYNTTAFPAGSISAISYTKDGAEFTGTPTEAGSYVASVTVGTGDGAATASVSYTVAAPTVAVTALGFEEHNEEVTVGDKVALTAEIEPDEATDKTVKWSVTAGSDKVALYLDADCTQAVGTEAISNLTVYIKGVSAGEATITVTSNADSQKYDYCIVTVNEATVAVTGVTISPNTTQTIDVDAVVSFTATVEPSTATNRNVIWSSYDTGKVKLYKDAECKTEVGDQATDVLTVYAKGISAGSTTIEVTSEEALTLYAPCNITVNTPANIVTYKVVNGTWSDGSTTDKTETVASGSKPASVPTGMKASEGYTGGAWDTDPADATITGAKTFTYTFTAKQAATVTKAPTSKTLTYTGSAQELVTAGTASGGTMQYALGTDATTAPTTGYTTSIPTATDAGTYYVWYKVIADSNHNDSDAACVTVTIDKANSIPATVTGKNIEYTETVQDLVTVTGVAVGGTMQYAFGSETEAFGTFSSTVPTTGDIGAYGTFNIWYKVVGDDNHKDSEAECVKTTVLGPISSTVIFKVINGSWNDGTTDDKTVTLTGYEGETLKLIAEQIPAVGGKPNDTYKTGSWDVTPSTENALTDNITYTYTYAQKNSISVTVTFKVVNGSWGDGTREDKTVVLTGLEGDDLLLTIDDIPQVTKPDEGYRFGTGDWTPEEPPIIFKGMKMGDPITEDTTFTFTYGIETKEDEEKTTSVVFETETDDSENKVETAVTAVDCENLSDFTETQTEENVEVELTVKPVSKDKVDADASEKINNVVSLTFENVSGENIVTEYLEMDITKKVTTDGNTVETEIHDVERVLEIELSYDLTGKYNPVVIREHNGETTAFKKLSSRPAADAFEDATFFADTENNKIYLYSRYFSTYSIAYTTIPFWYVTFDDQNGNTTKNTVNDGALVTKPADPTRSGYTFAGWYKEAAATNAWDFSADKVSSDITIYAKWNEIPSSTNVPTYVPSTTVVNSYTITYDNNGGTGTIASQTVAGTIKLSANIFTREGYTFTEWNTKADGTGKAYEDKADLTLTSNITLYAQWKEAKPVETVTPEPVVDDKITKAEKSEGKIDINSDFKVYQSGNKVVVEWGEVENADRYVIYAAYCSSGAYKEIKVLDGNKLTMSFKKLNGKNIDFTKEFKVYVAAYRTVDGEEKLIASTIKAHVVGNKAKKRSNAASITVDNAEYSVKKGKTVTISATTTLVDPSKKQLSSKHAAEFRYLSTDKSVATVDKNGVVTGKKKGTCYIWVYSRNGLGVKVKVTVK